MIIAKVKCKCGAWIRLRAAGHGTERQEKTCWNCKPYPSKVEVKRYGGRIVGFINDVQVENRCVDVELDER